MGYQVMLKMTSFLLHKDEHYAGQSVCIDFHNTENLIGKERNFPKHFVFNTPNTQDKENILKAVRKKAKVTYDRKHQSND